VSEGKKTYWYASGGRRIAQPVTWQGWTLFGVWLVGMIGGSQLLIANLTLQIGAVPAVGVAVSWAVMLIAIYYVAVQKKTDTERTPESYWEEQDKSKGGKP